MPAIKTVLVADDTEFVRDRFRAALESAGHRAVVVNTAAALRARLRADLDKLDLVVLDLHLPDGRGASLVREIRKIDKGGCRSWCSAAPSPAPTKSANWPRSA